MIAIAGKEYLKDCLANWCSILILQDEIGCSLAVYCFLLEWLVFWAIDFNFSNISDDNIIVFGILFLWMKAILD